MKKMLFGVLLGSLFFNLFPLCVIAQKKEATTSFSVGLELLRNKGCLACHSLDGNSKTAPSLSGLWGKKRVVWEKGVKKEIGADSEYLLNSITQPALQIVEGYQKIPMPAFQLSAQEKKILLAFFQEAKKPISEEKVSLWHLILGLLLFVGGHLGLSSLPIRGKLIEKLGNLGFQGIYSVVALVGISWMCWGWAKAPFLPIWSPVTWTRYVPLLLMPVSFYWLIASLLTKSPTAAGQESQLEKGEEAVQGILKITRHPMLWSFVIWGASHIPPNGDVATVLFFLGFVFLCLFGMLHIDQRRRIAFPETWALYEQKTSMIPFAALLQKKAVFRWKDLVWWHLLLAIASYVGFLYLHSYLLGASPFPT